MKYDDLINKINYLKNLNNKSIKQTNIMFIPLTNKIITENDGREMHVQYDISKVIEDFLYIENKTIFFINEFLNSYCDILNIYKNLLDQKNSSFCIDKKCEELTYYFDSFVTAFSTIIEPAQKEILSNFVDPKEIEKYYPNRNKFGLYWQIYMLRNRILHTTKNRYSYDKKECSCYETFSSKIDIIHSDSVGNINFFSSLLDIYSDENIKVAVNMAIKDENLNPFDILFPNIAAKGYSKKKPYMLCIPLNIRFNYATSAIKLIEEIETVFNITNNLFINSLKKYHIDIGQLKNSRTIIKIDNININYSVSDVFDI